MKKIFLLSILLFGIIGLFAQEETTNKVVNESIFTDKLEITDTLTIPVFILADSIAKAIISNNDTLATTPWVRTYVDENSGGFDLQDILTNTDYSGYPNNRATGIIRVYNDDYEENQYLETEGGGYGSGFDNYKSSVGVVGAEIAQLVSDYDDTGIDRTTKIIVSSARARIGLDNNLTSTYSRLDITNSSMLITDNLNSKGLYFAADYSSGATDLWCPNWGAVKGAIHDSIVAYHNDNHWIMPSYTTTERDALTGVNGMIIYNTTTNVFNFYENGSWVTK